MADLDHLSAPHMAAPSTAFQCTDCPVADPGDCMAAGHCPHRDGPACRACGCTEDDACIEPDGRPCAWWSAAICTACAGIVQRFFSPAELTFLLHAAGGGDLNLTRPDAGSLTGEGVLDLRARLACLAPQKDEADDR